MSDCRLVLNYRKIGHNLCLRTIDYSIVTVHWSLNNTKSSAGPSATGLTIGSALLSGLAAAFSIFTALLLYCYPNANEPSQGYLPKINKNQLTQEKENIFQTKNKIGDNV